MMLCQITSRPYDQPRSKHGLIPQANVSTDSSLYSQDRRLTPNVSVEVNQARLACYLFNCHCLLLSYGPDQLLTSLRHNPPDLVQSYVGAVISCFFWHSFVIYEHGRGCTSFISVCTKPLRHVCFSI